MGQHEVIEQHVGSELARVEYYVLEGSEDSWRSSTGLERADFAVDLTFRAGVVGLLWVIEGIELRLERLPFTCAGVVGRHSIVDATELSRDWADLKGRRMTSVSSAGSDPCWVELGFGDRSVVIAAASFRYESQELRLCSDDILIVFGRRRFLELWQGSAPD